MYGLLERLPIPRPLSSYSSTDAGNHAIDTLEDPHGALAIDISACLSEAIISTHALKVVRTVDFENFSKLVEKTGQELFSLQKRALKMYLDAPGSINRSEATSTAPILGYLETTLPPDEFEQAKYKYAVRDERRRIQDEFAEMVRERIRSLQSMSDIE